MSNVESFQEHKDRRALSEMDSIEPLIDATEKLILRIHDDEERAHHLARLQEVRNQLEHKRQEVRARLGELCGT